MEPAAVLCSSSAPPRPCSPGGGVAWGGPAALRRRGIAGAGRAGHSSCDFVLHFWLARPRHSEVLQFCHGGHIFPPLSCSWQVNWPQLCQSGSYNRLYCYFLMTEVAMLKKTWGGHLMLALPVQTEWGLWSEGRYWACTASQPSFLLSPCCCPSVHPAQPACFPEHSP